MHVDAAMSSESAVVAAAVFSLPPTLSKMVASSPALTFGLCQPVLCWCLSGFLMAEGLNLTPAIGSSVCLHVHAHTMACQDAVAES